MPEDSNDEMQEPVSEPIVELPNEENATDTAEKASSEEAAQPVEADVRIDELVDSSALDVTAEVASEQANHFLVSYKTGTNRNPEVGDTVAYGIWRGHVTEVIDGSTIKITGLPAGANNKTFLFSYDGAGEFLGHSV